MEIGQSDMDEDDDLETHLEVKVVFCPDQLEALGETLRSVQFTIHLEAKMAVDTVAAKSQQSKN